MGAFNVAQLTGNAAPVAVPAGRVVRPLYDDEPLPPIKNPNAAPTTTAAPIKETIAMPPKATRAKRAPRTNTAAAINTALDLFHAKATPLSIDDVISQTDLTKPGALRALAAMRAEGTIVKAGGGGRGGPVTYRLAGATATAIAPASTAKPGRVKKAKAAPPPAQPADTPAAFYSISHDGCLGIVTDDAKLKLLPHEFATLRDFISRTEPVWAA